MAVRGSVLALALLAGCVASPGAPPMVDAREGAPLAFGEPVSTGIAVPPANDLLDAFVQRASFEPFVAADSKGRIFVAEARGSLAASMDGGRTFTLLPGPFHERMRTTGDVALAVGPDDSLWWAQTFNSGGTESRGVHVAVSHDAGLTWPVNHVVPADGQDRPWWAVGQDHAWLTWIEEGDLRVRASQTRDGGRTFDDAVALPLIAFGQGALASDGSMLVAGCFGLARTGDGELRQMGFRGSCTLTPMLTASRSGEIGLIAERDGALVISTSSDDGATWTRTTRIVGEEPLVLRGVHPPGPWGLEREGWFGLGYYVEGDEGVDLVVARLVEDTVHLGVAARGIGAQNATDRPANTDFSALTVLPDGRLVAAWAPAAGNIMVSVEASAPKLS